MQKNLKCVNYFITILFRTERERYYSHRSKSRKDPEKYITIIVDGNLYNFGNIIYSRCKAIVMHITVCLCQYAAVSAFFSRAGLKFSLIPWSEVYLIN